MISIGLPVGVLVSFNMSLAKLTRLFEIQTKHFSKNDEANFGQLVIASVKGISRFSPHLNNNSNRNLSWPSKFGL